VVIDGHELPSALDYNRIADGRDWTHTTTRVAGNHPDRSIYQLWHPRRPKAESV